MLKLRVIPTLLWKGFGLVKGVGFDSWRRVGTVLPAIKVYTARDVDELVLLDISATQERREPDYEALMEVAAECTVPLTVGGGIFNVGIVRRLLAAGADKVAINTAAYSDPTIVSTAAETFGSQCVIASIDAKLIDGEYRCVTHSGTVVVENKPAEWAVELARRGAGEILITSVDRDGTMAGYDITLVRQVAEAVDIPVIASGGAGTFQHMLDAIANGAAAVAAASIFHFTQQTPAEAKQFLREHGIPVRAPAVR